MKKYLLGVLALILSSNLYADCNKAYAAIGAGYKFDEQRYGNIDGKNFPFKNIDPLSARFELGIQCENGVSFGVSHHSQWRQGFPFNKIDFTLCAILLWPSNSNIAQPPNTR